MTSTRGMVDDLESSAPLGQRLPAVMQDDPFAMRFVSAFDTAFAPVLATLDDLAAYVDPHLAPDDFVRWLAGWVGVELGDATPPEVRRDLVAGAVELFRQDGTVAALAQAVALVTGGADVEITESGGARWSQVSGTALPGDASATVRVRVTAADGASVDRRRVAAAVAALVPAHVVPTVEVVP
ncbi:phage tail protein [Jatrophihabitans fulvus]